MFLNKYAIACYSELMSFQLPPITKVQEYWSPEVSILASLNEDLELFGCHIDAAEQQRALNFESLVRN